MSYGILLKETMSGWIRFDEDNTQQPFAFSIRAFTDEIFRLSAPRHFRGQASIGDAKPLPVSGCLTIRLTGPQYELDLSHEHHGNLHIAGHKTYRLNDIPGSFIRCPLTVYRDGQAIGEAEVAYRDSIWRFPFEALAITREEQAYGPFSKPVNS